MRWRFARDGYDGTLYDGSGRAVGHVHASILGTATERLRHWPRRSYVAFMVTDDFSPRLKWPSALTESSPYARTYLIPCRRGEAENLARELGWWNGRYVSDGEQLIPSDQFERVESLCDDDVFMKLYVNGEDVVAFDIEYGHYPVRHIQWRKGGHARHGAYDFAPDTVIHPAATLEGTFRGKIPATTLTAIDGLRYAYARHRDTVMAALVGLS